MALDAKKVYALSKKYTDDTVNGAGAIKGANCIISAITPITGGNKITFEWILNDGTPQSEDVDVMNGVNGTDGTDGTDGADGVGIASIDFKQKDADGNNVYTVTYTDGNSDEIVCPIGPKGEDGAGVPDGGTTGQILAKKSNADGDTKWVDPSAASQVQSDWAQNDDTKVDYIKHKPTKLSDFSNDEGFIKNTVDNLVEYYKKSETYTQTEVNNLISAIVTLNMEVVPSLPTTDISETTIYLVPKSTSGINNAYDEWICTDASVPTWEKIGDTEIDLSGYALKSEMSVTNGTGADADKVTIQLKNGTSATVLKEHQDISGKQNNITISGKKVQI